MTINQINQTNVENILKKINKRVRGHIRIKYSAEYIKECLLATESEETLIKFIDNEWEPNKRGSDSWTWRCVRDMERQFKEYLKQWDSVIDVNATPVTDSDSDDNATPVTDSDSDSDDNADNALLYHVKELMERLQNMENALADRDEQINALKAQIAQQDSKSGVIDHNMTAEIVEHVRDGYNVYLWGNAGTGKSQIAERVAEICGLEFQTSSRVEYTTDLFGYKNANGEYVPTAFYDCYKNGGLFLFDEADSSTPECLTSLNNAISSDYHNFPCGKVMRHHDFRCIATGNTNGKGATLEFNTRVKIDDSFLDRFKVIKIDYDENIDNAVAGNNAELVEFCHLYRRAIKELGLSGLFSYRGLSMTAKDLAKYPDRDFYHIFDQNVFKGKELDELRSIAGQINEFGCNTYGNQYISWFMAL